MRDWVGGSKPVKGKWILSGDGWAIKYKKNGNYVVYRDSGYETTKTTKNKRGEIKKITSYPS